MKRAWPMLLFCLVAARAEAADTRYALVVGFNGSSDPRLAPLRYADDDAVRYHALFSRLVSESASESAGDSLLLTSLDDESRGLYPGVAPIAPTRANLIAGLDSLQQRMASDIAAGARPTLYFVYSGHGGVDREGKGYVYLDGDRLSYRDMYDLVISRSAGQRLVVIVDACNSSLLVQGRGGGSTRDRVAAAPTAMKLDNYPNVGVLLSSDRPAEVHEWGKYLAGVFSHELRSALLGTADLNDDRVISFREVEAYLDAANAAVKNPAARVRPFVRPTDNDPDAPVVDLADMRGVAMLRVPGAFSGKAHMVDAQLVRYADFNKTAEVGFSVALLDRGRYALVHGGDEYRVDASGDVDLGALRPDAAEAKPRGVLSEYFDARLYQTPYGPEYAKSFFEHRPSLDLAVEETAPRMTRREIMGWSAIGAGVAAAGLGGYLTYRAWDAYHDADSTKYGSDVARLNERKDTFQNWSYFAYGVGVAAMGSGAFLLLVEPEEAALPAFLTGIFAGPSGVGVEGKF